MTYPQTHKEFHELYEQEFTLDPKEELARQLAQEYHDRCEAYDRTVCTGPIIKGGIVPIGHNELALVNRNAITVLRELERKAADANISALFRYHRVHHNRRAYS